MLVFLTIGRAHQHYGFIGALQPALLLFGAGAAYAVLSPGSVRWQNLWSTWPPRVVAALGLLACLSVPFALSMGTAGSFMIDAFSKVLLTFFLLVVAIRGPRDLYLFVWAYVLGCGFLVYLSIFTFAMQYAGTIQRLGGLYFYDSNDLGVVLTAGIPLCLVLLQNSGKIGKATSGLILLGIGASLARSGSRGGFLGLLAVGIALFFLLRNVSVLKRVGAVVVLAAGLFAMAPAGYWSQMESMTEPTDDYNWTSPYGRKAVAERGMNYMLDHPVVGVGVGNFQRAEGLLAEESIVRAQSNLPYRWSAAHNSFVQAGAELGIPGLLLFCSLVFGSILGMARLRKRLPRSWGRRGGEHGFLYDLATYLPVSMVGFAVAGFFVSFAYHDVLYVLIVFVTGTYLCAGALVRRENAARTADDVRTLSSRSRVSARSR
jgi:O-antigen ligase